MRVVTLGEMMIRFMPKGNLRFEQATEFEAHYGGDESIVAVSLARFGLDSRYVTKLPENPFWCGIFILLLLQTIGAVLMELDVLPGLSLLLIASPGGIFSALEVVLKACLYVFLAIAAIVLFPVLILIPIITGFSVTSFVTGLFK